MTKQFHYQLIFESLRAMFYHAYNFMFIFFYTNLKIVLTQRRIILIIIFIFRFFGVLFPIHSIIIINISLLRRFEWTPSLTMIWKKFTIILSNLFIFIYALFSWKLSCLARLRIDRLYSFFCIVSTILLAYCWQFSWSTFCFSFLKKHW